MSFGKQGNFVARLPGIATVFLSRAVNPDGMVFLSVPDPILFLALGKEAGCERRWHFLSALGTTDQLFHQNMQRLIQGDFETFEQGYQALVYWYVNIDILQK